MRIPNKDVLQRLNAFGFAYTARYYYYLFSEPVVSGYYLIQRSPVSSSGQHGLPDDQCLITEKRLKEACLP